LKNSLDLDIRCPCLSLPSGTGDVTMRLFFGSLEGEEEKKGSVVSVFFRGVPFVAVFALARA
jgi:hypothetical protein